MIMNRKCGLAGQRKDAETESSRGTGMHSAEAEEGKFHVSV